MRAASLLRSSVAMIAALLIAGTSNAAEIITAEDFAQETVLIEQLIRVADNAVFMLDNSTSMAKPYEDTDRTTYEVVLDEFKRRNGHFPSLGHRFAIYLYTPWEEILAPQVYDRAKVAEALESMPTETSGGTRLASGLDKVDEVLDALPGRTALFVVTDGTYTGNWRPMDKAMTLAKKHDVCFYVISTAEDEVNAKILERLADLNACSRVIPFDQYIDNPYYTSGALFQVKATENVVTVADQKVVGLAVDDLTFEFDHSEVQARDLSELDQAVAFLAEHPQAWAVISGYSDDIGTEEVNSRISQERAETVAEYLTKAGIDEDRLVVFWFGSANPVADNSTDEGRAKNRRVEMAIGMKEGMSAAN